MRIYLDMCSIQRPFDDRSQPRIRVESEAVLAIVALCESGAAELLDSDALRLENLRNPHPLRRGYTEELLEKAAESIHVDDEVEQRAIVYVNSGIKPVDALHLALAVAGGADYFCTCDDKLLKRARQVETGSTRPVSALELIAEIAR